MQATGHGALPIGPDTILVHTGGMNSCAVDALNRTARVGDGVTWQQVLDAAAGAQCGGVVGSRADL